VYKVDFEAERSSREALNDERLKLQEKLLAAEEELQALKLTNHMAEMRVRQGYAGGRQSGGGVMEEVRPADVHPSWRSAQEHSASLGAAAGGGASVVATSMTAAPAEAQLPNRTTLEVSLVH